jgi:hypothetical protein
LAVTFGQSTRERGLIAEQPPARKGMGTGPLRGYHPGLPMSETPEPATESTSLAENSADSAKPARLRRILTWVGIVAGAVFVVAAIFVSGAATAWLSGGHGHPRHEAACMMDMKGMNDMKDMPKGPMPADKDCCGKKGPADTDCCEPKKT